MRWRAWILFLIFQSCSIFLYGINATYSWSQGGGGDWENSSNWLPTGYPHEYADNAFFENVFHTPDQDATIQINQNNTVYKVLLSDEHDIRLKKNTSGAMLTLRQNEDEFFIIFPPSFFSGGSRNHSIEVPIRCLDDLEIKAETIATEIHFTEPFLAPTSPEPGKSQKLYFSGVGKIFLAPSTKSTVHADSFIQGTVYYDAKGALPFEKTVDLGYEGSSTLVVRAQMDPEDHFQLIIEEGSKLQQGLPLTSGIPPSIFLMGIQMENTNFIELNNADGLLQFDSFPTIPMNISGTISGGVASSSPDWNSGNRIIMTGEGTLFLNGNNTFTSRLFIASDSTVQVTTSAAVGASGPNSACFVRSGGAFELNPNVVSTFAKDFFLNGSGVDGNGALKIVNQTNTISGNVTIGWSNSSLESPEDVTINVLNNSLTLSGVLSGNQNLTKNGNGSLILSGGSANSFSGLTVLNFGTIQLSKVLGPALSSIEVNGGSLVFDFQNQLSSLAKLTLNGGSADFQNHNQTFNSLFYNQGNINLGSGQLFLTSFDHALVMGGNTTLSGTVNLTERGDIHFDKTFLGMAKILGTLNLGAFDHTFDIDNGGSLVDMEVNALTTSTGKMIKEGLGTLKFSNHADFSSVEIAAGKLFASGSMNAPIVIVEDPATLGGNGTINGDVFVTGTVAPGESIGTLTVSGNVTFQNSSTFSAEFNTSSHDLLEVIGGKVNILPGSTIAIQPQKGNYPENFQFTVIDAPGSVTGMFSSITNKTPLFKVFYHPQRVDLIIRRVFTTDVPNGNPGSVAGALDHITPVPLGDMEDVIEFLESIDYVPELRSYLNTMHPAIYKGMALLQQKNSFCFRKTLVNRSDSFTSTPALWFDVLSDVSLQKSQGELFGYKSFSPMVVIGFDGYAKDHVKFGGALGYSFSDVDMRKKSGTGRINSIYGALYGSVYKNKLFFDGVLSGGYHYFHHVRNILLGEETRIAKSKNRGLEVGCYFASGIYCKWRNFEITPYLAVDDSFVRENEYQEKGAEDLNLGIDQSSYNVLKGEIGVHFSQFYEWSYCDFVPDLKLAILKPWRHGSHYTCHFVNYPDQEFVVRGQKPDDIIYSPAISLTALRKDHFSYQFSYNVELQRKYQNHMLNLEVAYSF